jgi:two-component system OmpR family sensor kinase
LNSKFGKAWERISLRTKLTALSVAIIGVLVFVSSLGTIALLRTYLQENLDRQLISTAETLSNEDPTKLEDRLATNQLRLPSLPIDFYIAYLDTDGTLLIGLASSAGATKGDVPNTSNFNSINVIATNGIPFEVNTLGEVAEDAGIRGWRMITVPLTTMPGSLVVALPTGANSALLAQYGLIGGGFGGLLLILSGLSIWLTINSALKPLNEVERTAEAVTEGDISKRLIDQEGNTEISRLNRSLNTMLDGIQTAMQDRSKTLDQMRRFVSDASHELRTPLVSVRGYAELYRMGALKKPEQIGEAMERIESEAIRMTGLVESLLTLTRMDEATKLELAKTNMASLAVDAAKDASVADMKRQIEVTDMNGKVLASDAVIEANVDANSMRQVLTNLLANASRFSQEGAQIEIALDDNAMVNGRPCLVLEVRDHGEGIPEQLREKIFERFYRVDNSRNSETGGSGLGLAIVATIVARHNGTIVALETPGGGATFRVAIPA